jgi:glyoxylase-like metal-dependent hydrolase (beta-lactamase superfamily II)
VAGRDLQAQERDDYQRLLAEAGVTVLGIPTPFPVGRVNVYLLAGDPPALLDCGPNSARSLLALERGLNEAGVGIEEIGYLLLTHQHVDHLGLAEAVVERSGAKVVASHPLAAYLRQSQTATPAEQEFAERLMAAHGVPREVIAALRGSAGAVRAWGSVVGVEIELGEGEVVDLGSRHFELYERPGHSPSDTLFFDRDRGLLFGGDHLLAEISSNPVITPPADPTAERPRPLPTYLRSLRKTAAMEGVGLVLPGHGEPIPNPRALIESRLRFHAKRARKLLGLLEEPLTAHDLARRMWGEVALSQAYLTLSEVLGHLDLLEEEGLVEPIEEAGLIRYRALADSSSSR